MLLAAQGGQLTRWVGYKYNQSINQPTNQSIKGFCAYAIMYITIGQTETNSGSSTYWK